MAAGILPPMSNAFPIPDILRDLGDPLQVHPPRALGGRTGYLIVAVVLLIVCGLTVIAAVHPPQNNPPPQIVVIIVMCITFVASTVFFVLAMLSKSYTLILFPDALARTGGGATEVFRWSDVRDLYPELNPLAPKCRLVTQDGRKFQIDNRVKDSAKLGADVQQAVFDHMMPAALEAFGYGRTVEFGPLGIDQNYLHYKDKRLAWSEVAQMQLAYNGYTRSIQFEARAAGSMLPWCSVKVQDIPNVDVFKALAERRKPFTE